MSGAAGFGVKVASEAVSKSVFGKAATSAARAFAKNVQPVSTTVVRSIQTSARNALKKGTEIATEAASNAKKEFFNFNNAKEQGEVMVLGESPMMKVEKVVDSLKKVKEAIDKGESIDTKNVTELIVNALKLELTINEIANSLGLWFDDNTDVPSKESDVTNTVSTDHNNGLPAEENEEQNTVSTIAGLGSLTSAALTLGSIETKIAKLIITAAKEFGGKKACKDLSKVVHHEATEDPNLAHTALDVKFARSSDTSDKVQMSSSTHETLTVMEKINFRNASIKEDINILLQNPTNEVLKEYLESESPDDLETNLNKIKKRVKENLKEEVDNNNILDETAKELMGHYFDEAVDSVGENKHTGGVQELGLANQVVRGGFGLVGGAMVGVATGLGALVTGQDVRQTVINAARDQYAHTTKTANTGAKIVKLYTDSEHTKNKSSDDKKVELSGDKESINKTIKQVYKESTVRSSRRTPSSGSSRRDGVMDILDRGEIVSDDNALYTDKTLKFMDKFADEFIGAVTEDAKKNADALEKGLPNSDGPEW